MSKPLKLAIYWVDKMGLENEMLGPLMDSVVKCRICGAMYSVSFGHNRVVCDEAVKVGGGKQLAFHFKNPVWHEPEEVVGNAVEITENPWLR